MATIIQRVVNNQGNGDVDGITDAEKEELLAELDNIQNAYKAEKKKDK
jgi:hypothetical protein